MNVKGLILLFVAANLAACVSGPTQNGRAPSNYVNANRASETFTKGKLIVEKPAALSVGDIVLDLGDCREEVILRSVDNSTSQPDLCELRFENFRLFRSGSNYLATFASGLSFQIQDDHFSIRFSRARMAQSEIEKEISLILEVVSNDQKKFRVSGKRLTLLDVKFLDLP